MRRAHSDEGFRFFFSVGDLFISCLRLIPLDLSKLPQFSSEGWRVLNFAPLGFSPELAIIWRCFPARLMPML